VGSPNVCERARSKYVTGVQDMEL